MNNIIEAAKEENLEKNKIKMKDKEEIINLNNKNQKSKSISIKENKIKHNYKLHPKPEKPIDYLKDIIKQKRNKSKNKIDIEVGSIFDELREGTNNSGRNQIIETLEMVKSKTKAIDRKVLEKKECLKIKGGYINNTKLGDEVGNLLIKSIQTKLSLLKHLNE